MIENQISNHQMRIFFTLAFFFTCSILTAQTPHHNSLAKSHSSAKINYNGQWRGGFNESSNTISDITYVLELEINGSVVGGYSYTYFNEPPRRYYTICRVNGTLDRATGDLVVTEVERLRYNTPPDFINCFQTHRLHYVRVDDSTEELRGTWEPAPNQGLGCGHGKTVLVKRIKDRTPLGVGTTPKGSVAMTPQKKPSPTKKTAPSVQKPDRPAPKNEVVKAEPVRPKLSSPETGKVKLAPPAEQKASKTTPEQLRTRRNDIVKTIVIEKPTFKADFYDNGEIDGDSISVYYNGELVLSNQMLTDKPLTLILPIDKNIKENVLTMYAENLGSIPPNTALMIVTDGKKRYEVRLESDLKKSGSVIFKSSDE